MTIVIHKVIEELYVMIMLLQTTCHLNAYDIFVFYFPSMVKVLMSIANKFSCHYDVLYLASIFILHHEKLTILCGRSCFYSITKLLIENNLYTQNIIN
jgi:hypothetical protein